MNVLQYRRNMNEMYKPLMARSLEERQSITWEACREAVLLGPVSHISAVDMWKVERPSQTNFVSDKLHVTVSDPRLSRLASPDAYVHCWSGLDSSHIRYTTDGIGVLNAEATWALMAKGTQVDGLTELGESMIRHGRTTESKLRDFVEHETFQCKAKCYDALTLMDSSSDSPKETQTRLCLYSYGLWGFTSNYSVPGISFDNGAAITLDLADPELLIGIEYDGDHHRTDRTQWRRDAWNRRQLESMGWTVVSVTQLDLSDEPHRAAFAMNIAAIRARKLGRPIALSTPLPWRKVACRMRRMRRI